MIQIDFVSYDHLCQMVHFLIAGHIYWQWVEHVIVSWKIMKCTLESISYTIYRFYICGSVNYWASVSVLQHSSRAHRQHVWHGSAGVCALHQLLWGQRSQAKMARHQSDYPGNWYVTFKHTHTHTRTCMHTHMHINHTSFFVLQDA